jgi:two-component system, sensor histidine kinase YesM
LTKKLLKSSISTKLLLIICFFFIIPFITLFFASYSITEKILYSKINKSTNQYISQLNSSVEAFADDLRKASSIMLFDGKLVNLLKYYSGYPYNNIYFNTEGIKSSKEVSSYDYLQISKEFDNTFISITNNVLSPGSLIGVFSNNGTQFSTWSSYLTNKQFFADMKVFDKAITQKGVPFYIGPHESYISGEVKQYFSYVKLLNNDLEPSQWYGVLVISIPIDNLYNIIKNSNASGFADVLITDENGNIITNILNFSQASTQISDLYFNKIKVSNSGSFAAKIAKEDFLINYNTVKLLNWKIISIVPHSVMFKEVHTLRTTIIYTAFFIIFSFSILTIYSIYKLTAPLRKLKRTMEKVTSGDLTVSINNINNKDEVGVLASTFNSMLSKINELIRTVAEDEKKAAELRFEMLVAQINPHFLFNTLNSIKWMAMMSRAYNVSETITALGRLLEISMNKQNDMITIKEELENIKSYIIIQRARYKESFNITYDITEDILECKTLKLILQPFVENSILHNIDENGKLIDITLRGRRVGDCIEFSVKDNGKGIPSGVLETLVAEKDNGISKVFRGIGITNVNERIRLKYGLQYGISMSSLPGVGTTIKIIHPVDA